MMNATTSGLRRAISWVACLGQSKNFGLASPLDTRESYTGATTPVAAVVLPSDGPSEPARELPPIQSFSGVGVVSGDLHRVFVVAAAAVVVRWVTVGAGSRSTVGRLVASPVSITPVSQSAAVAVSTVATTKDTMKRVRPRRSSR